MTNSQLAALVARFSKHEQSYTSGAYNETQLRREFLDPLLTLLEWDVDNQSGKSETYKDVVHEDAVAVDGVLRAPDYSVRVGGRRQFFVEAKKPSVDIGTAMAPAYQLKRYAWSANLPVSVLCDFEELAVYDCRLKPEPSDPATKGRLLLVRYTEYVDRWPEIASLFSKSAVESGALEAYAVQLPSRRGQLTVDEAFLAEIESWRELLARNLANRNESLEQRDLNWAVQRIIDRIVFLRICEDRGIESYGSLREAADGARTYQKLQALFERADDRYNSGLFHFRIEKQRPAPPDTLTPALVVDDQPLKQIIRRLYYPESPYEFSVVPADILGQVYERFLGKVIRLTTTHRAVVEEKPEVRKAGGVYYTPTHIVDHMVHRTLGVALEGKRAGSRGSASKVRVLDPACGSGSFLIGAYQFLLDWHLEWYLSQGHGSKSGVLVPTVRGGLRLSTQERKRILLNSIFGVDIDAQAVETTKLSLLLKVLEGESDETISSQLALLHTRALPDLDNNIKSGNSLVSPDFYEQGQLGLLSEDEQFKVNPFDWNDEFPGVMRSGGFDVVIGNPPYIFGEYHNDNTKTYLQARFETAQRQYDTYALFVERGLSLTRKGGNFAMIVPDAVLARDEAIHTRKILLDNGLAEVYHCGLVFDVGVSAVVLVAKKGTTKRIQVEVRAGTTANAIHDCDRKRFLADPGRRLLIHATDAEATLLASLADGGQRLGDYISISRGEEIGKKHVYQTGPIPILVGEDISRYCYTPPSRFVRTTIKSGAHYRADKIIVVKTGATCVAALDSVGVVTMQSVYNVHVSGIDPRVVLAILNSQIARFHIQKTFTAYKLLFPQLNQTTLESIPFPKNLRQFETKITDAVDEIADLSRRLKQAQAPPARKQLERRITRADSCINELIYKSYRLSVDQIKLIEAATR